MTSQHADQLYYDSEAILRLVDNALDDLHTPLAIVPSAEPTRPAIDAIMEEDSLSLSNLPHMLLRAYQEINAVVSTLRRSRDVLEESTVQKLHQTGNKLREVSSATEVAATDMLDGLDRALVLVDDLDAESATESSERSTELRDDLRNELFSLMNCLQFQDITTQQLGYASSVLIEVEERLSDLAKIFDPQSLGLNTPALVPQILPNVAFDPAATTTDAEVRQALVDQIFATT